MKLLITTALLATLSVGVLSYTTASTAQTNAATPTMADIPENAPAIGTNIIDLIQIVNASATANTKTATEITWDDLVPEGYRPAEILAKYETELNSFEGTYEEEIALYTKINDEYNNAPANLSLAGQTVRIPGFIAPLDEYNGTVAEFLLVPYFGSCIHAPPPPINQTIWVDPQLDKSVAMEDTYEPIWVVGEIEVSQITTDLAQAGYQIKNARLEKY